MKYWNKSKKTRLRCWHKVSRPVDFALNSMKRYLQWYPSDGRFYCAYGNNYIWFEKESDAVFFALKWSQ